jgi:hypothetical protein
MGCESCCASTPGSACCVPWPRVHFLQVGLQRRRSLQEAGWTLHFQTIIGVWDDRRIVPVPTGVSGMVMSRSIPRRSLNGPSSCLVLENCRMVSSLVVCTDRLPRDRCVLVDGHRCRALAHCELAGTGALRGGVFPPRMTSISVAEPSSLPGLVVLGLRYSHVGTFRRERAWCITHDSDKSASLYLFKGIITMLETTVFCI